MKFSKQWKWEKTSKKFSPPFRLVINNRGVPGQVLQRNTQDDGKQHANIRTRVLIRCQEERVTDGTVLNSHRAAAVASLWRTKAVNKWLLLMETEDIVREKWSKGSKNSRRASHRWKDRHREEKKIESDQKFQTINCVHDDRADFVFPVLPKGDSGKPSSKLYFTYLIQSQQFLFFGFPARLIILIIEKARVHQVFIISGLTINWHNVLMLLI